MGELSNMKRMFEWIFDSSKSDDKTRGPLGRRQLVLLAIIGVALIFIGNFFVKDKEVMEEPSHPQVNNEQVMKTKSDVPENDGMLVTEIEQSYEKHLEAMLNKMTGVSEAEVMVNLDSTNIKVFAENIVHGQQTTDETDRNGGQRKVEDKTEETHIVLTRQGDQEVPLLIHTKKPPVRGVFIVAKGVDHGNVKMSVIDAVSKVLDVSTHKVSVMPKN